MNRALLLAQDFAWLTDIGAWGVFALLILIGGWLILPKIIDFFQNVLVVKLDAILKWVRRTYRRMVRHHELTKRIAEKLELEVHESELEIHDDDDGGDDEPQ